MPQSHYDNIGEISSLLLSLLESMSHVRRRGWKRMSPSFIPEKNIDINAYTIILQ